MNEHDHRIFVLLKLQITENLDLYILKTTFFICRYRIQILIFIIRIIQDGVNSLNQILSNRVFSHVTFLYSHHEIYIIQRSNLLYHAEGKYSKNGNDKCKLNALTALLNHLKPSYIISESYVSQNQLNSLGLFPKSRHCTDINLVLSQDQNVQKVLCFSFGATWTSFNSRFVWSSHYQPNHEVES